MQNAFFASLADNGVKYYISCHDHINQRSIIASPDGASKVQEIIGASNSSKLYTPKALTSSGWIDPVTLVNQKTRETSVAQDLYTAYQGNGRRVITVPVVDSLAPNTATPMVVLGFRQFLVQPNPDGTFFNPSDPNGRFVATYIGSPMPVKQGYIDDRFWQSCPAPVTSGPGKVVLHR